MIQNLIYVGDLLGLFRIAQEKFKILNPVVARIKAAGRNCDIPSHAE